MSSGTDHHHETDPRSPEVRTEALEDLLVEKGIVDRARVEALIERFENDLGPMVGARLVAKAWLSPEFRRRLLDDADEGMEFKIQNSLHGKAIQDNTIFCSNSWFDEYPNMGRFKSGDMNEYNFMSVLSIPLRSDGESRGAITLELLRSKVYSDTDIRLLKLLCSKISTILNWQKVYKKVHLTSIHDGLTGLLNHKAFLNRFEEEISRAGRFNQMFGLVILDLDKFKSVNDSYGHLYGDYVLEGVAKIISESVRTIDVVGRYGGEEFVIALPGMDLDGTVLYAENLRKQVVQLAIPNNTRSGRARFVTVSIGVSVAMPSSNIQSADLIRQADQALYDAKEQGRNRVCVAVESLDPASGAFRKVQRSKDEQEAPQQALFQMDFVDGNGVD